MASVSSLNVCYGEIRKNLAIWRAFLKTPENFSAVLRNARQLGKKKYGTTVNIILKYLQSM